MACAYSSKATFCTVRAYKPASQLYMRTKAPIHIIPCSLEGTRGGPLGPLRRPRAAPPPGASGAHKNYIYNVLIAAIVLCKIF